MIILFFGGSDRVIEGRGWVVGSSVGGIGGEEFFERG